MYSLSEIVFSFIPGGNGDPVGVGLVGEAVDAVVVTIHEIILVCFYNLWIQDVLKLQCF